jgi:hypothetical protein
MLCVAGDDIVSRLAVLESVQDELNAALQGKASEAVADNLRRDVAAGAATNARLSEEVSRKADASDVLDVHRRVDVVETLISSHIAGSDCSLGRALAVRGASSDPAAVIEPTSRRRRLAVVGAAVSAVLRSARDSLRETFDAESALVARTAL